MVQSIERRVWKPVNLAQDRCNMILNINRKFGSVEIPTDHNEAFTREFIDVGNLRMSVGLDSSNKVTNIVVMNAKEIFKSIDDISLNIEDADDQK